MKKPLGAHTERLSTFRPPRESEVVYAKELSGRKARRDYFAGVATPECSVFAAPPDLPAAGLAEVLSDL